MNAILRRLLVSATRTSAFSAGVSMMERLARQRTDRLWVLTYHRVDEPEARPHLDPDLISATPTEFRQQAEYLAARCRVVALDEVLSCLSAGGSLPPRAVLLTFDDAYRDFAEHAWPVLRGLGLPATLFVPTAFPDQPSRRFWWDRVQQALLAADEGALETPLGALRAATDPQRRQARRRLKRWFKALPHDEAERSLGRCFPGNGHVPPDNGVLGWAELRRLAEEGVSLGAHTRTHPLLHRVSLHRACEEVLGSLEDLRQRVGPHVPAVLAYPGGGWDDGLVDELRQAGLTAAFTTGRGVNALRKLDPLRIRRINVGRATTMSLLRAQLLPR